MCIRDSIIIIIIDNLREFACHTTVILAQPRVSRLRVAAKNAFHRDGRDDREPAAVFAGRFRVEMAQIWSLGEQESRRFVASMLPRCGRLAALKIPRGDGANLETP